VANAEHADSNVDVDRLYVNSVLVDKAAVLRRWRPRAHGRATGVRKPTAHITVILASREE
jgi:large subunit ribosomal protein L22